MSGRFFKKRRTSSVSQQSQLANDEYHTADGGAVGSGRRLSKPRAIRAHSNTSVTAAGLSSSYSLPSRSYIHHAGHGKPDSAHYSSAGLRDQTEALSESFVSGDSNMEDFVDRQSPENRESAFLEPKPRPAPRRHSDIEECSEPVTPDGTQAHPAPPSNLSELFKSSPPLPDSGESHSHSRRRPSTRHNLPDVVVSNEDTDDADGPSEASPLLVRERLTSSHRKPMREQVAQDVEAQPLHKPGAMDSINRSYPSLHKAATRAKHVANPRHWNVQHIVRKGLVEPARTLPAVFLGLLLNLLDALSYGIILFPLGEEVFSQMGPDGVSMFYVSCIIAQLVYSSGSIFRGGVGSEMIEVVPFFHKMTYMVMQRMGTGNPDALRATVITSYSMSSILTGLVFFGLGSAKLGTLVNFFPHSILTGCIGGVGIFLFLTGIEVSARLPGNFEFTAEVFHRLFTKETAPLWIPPLGMAVLLMVIKSYYDRPWLVPAYYVGITAIFYIVVTAVPALKMEDLRDLGWVFEAPAAGVPFYNFYSYYKFSLVDWSAIWMTVPSQLALTFFGILHVPINVPNLAMVVQEDNVSINRELLLHGVSNTLSGCVGSIQNYLVFVNSALFIDTGGNSRLAGFLLAAATFGLWVAGPIVIGYVPVMVVGTLIYYLGIDLANEALYSTWGKLGRLEYFTIFTIALVMGIYDFVVGIAVGIGLACLVYVVQTSRKTVIRAEFSGEVAESTVRRHPRQRNYLHKVGKQIRIVKLGGYLFFGSIVKVEKKVRATIEEERFAKEPIRFLIVDFSHVTGLDFSAAEAFTRMNRILDRRGVTMVLAGVSLYDDVGRSLQMVGLFEPDESTELPAPELYEDLNGALEACENDLLVILNEKQAPGSKGEESPPVPVPQPQQPRNFSVSPFHGSVGSPRRNFLHQAAATTITEAGASEQSKWQNFKQPLPLLLQAFQDLTNKNEDFWFRLTPYFTKACYTAGETLYSRGDEPDGFYLLQSGMLRAEYDLDQGAYHESIVSGTTCGELPFFSETRRTSKVVAEKEVVAWLLTKAKWEELQEKDGEVAKELLKVGMKLSAERMNAITSYVLITAS